MAALRQAPLQGHDSVSVQGHVIQKSTHLLVQAGGMWRARMEYKWVSVGFWVSKFACFHPFSTITNSDMTVFPSLQSTHCHSLQRHIEVSRSDANKHRGAKKVKPFLSELYLSPRRFSQSKAESTFLIVEESPGFWIKSKTEIITEWRSVHNSMYPPLPHLNMGTSVQSTTELEANQVEALSYRKLHILMGYLFLGNVGDWRKPPVPLVEEFHAVGLV